MQGKMRFEGNFRLKCAWKALISIVKGAYYQLLVGIGLYWSLCEIVLLEST
jgi:hypothetical protein